MTTNRIVFFSILIATLIICADVFAHGYPLAHFQPYTAEDPCWKSQCEDSDYSGGHGHIVDRDIWGYWTCEGYQYLFPETDCGEEPEAPQPEPQPEPQPQVEPPRTETPQPQREPEPQRSYHTPEPALEEVREQSSSSDRSWDRLPIEPPSENIIFPLVPEPEPEIVILEKHEWKLFEGYTLIGFPIRVFDDEHNDYLSEVEDFYHDSDVFNSSTEGIFEHINAAGIDQEWWFYQGEGLLGNMPAVGNHGVIVLLDEGEEVELEGVANYGKESVQIRVGWNLIGLPEVTSNYEFPSDFLSDSICIVLITDETGFRLIGRAGDLGDVPLYAGQGVLLFSTMEMILNLSASAPAAPSASRQNTLATSWGRIKSR